jgi:penicillin G amidase
MSKRKVRSWINLVLAIALGGGVTYALSIPMGPIGAIAETFNPGDGVWTSAAKDQILPHDETLNIKGLEKPVHIIFEKDGTSHVQAETNHDAFLAIGYLHAKNRLFEMDIMRRQGSGTLAEALGKFVIEEDYLQRQIGLDRTADAEWDMLPKDSETRKSIEAYTAGVNEVITDQTANHQLPMLFKLLGFEPRPWKPQDSFIIKGYLAQMMSLSGAPMYRELLFNALGEENAMKLLPELPTTEQHPYFLGPYQQHPLDPFPISAEQMFIEKGASQVSMAPARAERTGTALASTGNDSDPLAGTLAVIQKFEKLPSYAFHHDTNSNGWVVDGTKTVSGKPLLAGDPHLEVTLPSVWYQLQIESPDYKYAGVTAPGVPFPLVGHNDNISWTMTNGQAPQSFFYEEKTDEAHPDQYFWKGEWHDFASKTFQIPLKGGGTEPFEVKYSVHGPILNRHKQTVAMDWIGQYPSQSMAALNQVMKAKNFDEFKTAFSGWTAPTMNFVYADQSGNIGVVAAGTYAQFGKGVKPYLPMPGTGEADIIGKIPYADIPQSYNPPSHFIASANQYLATSDYPYYIGTPMDYDPGERSNRLFQKLSTADKLTGDDMKALQYDVKDTLAEKIVPVLLQTLKDASLSDQEKQAVAQLSTWNYQMDGTQTAPSIWYDFWEQYLHTTFDPWWEAYKVPWQDDSVIKISPMLVPLDNDLEAWTLHDPNNSYFTNPITKEKRDAKQVMVQAFQAAIKDLQKRGGEQMSGWEWEKLHTRRFPSIILVPALGEPAKGTGGDIFTINLAPNWEATRGPSWRMISDMSTGKSIGIYPGGQSDNPISPWYKDRIDKWSTGEYRELLNYQDAAAQPKQAEWTLTPAP